MAELVLSSTIKCISLSAYMPTMPARIVHPAVLPSSQPQPTASYTTLETFVSSFADKDSNTPTNSTSTVKRQATVYCLDEKCTPNVDWLTYRPSKAVGWALGSVSAACAIGLLISVAATRTPMFMDAVLALLELCVSLYLRSAISQGIVNERAAYKASLFFQYHAGIELCHVVGAMVCALLVHFDPMMLTKTKYARRVLRIVTVSLAVVAGTGAIIMFNGTHGAGMRLMQASSFAVVVVCGAMACVVVRTMGCTGASNYKRQFGMILVVIVLVAVWAAFSGSRTLVHITSPARSSEALFVVLGYATLLTSGLALLVLKAPYYYNFDYASRWSSKV
ncbi:hypothetical protein GGF49_002327 [Coemansia sp. RSA 1853]|nr:hypothetical protein LPJ76_004523 [Coemansia sp. RSA 638]KAJ2543080.1 hypothetical protein GGF49_002327 [Coemansia sp. RSA 1853]